MATSNKRGLSFEAALSELEAIVGAMETGKLPLDEALARYQRGVDLLKECTNTLRAAEQKITVLETDSLRELDPALVPASTSRRVDEQ